MTTSLKGSQWKFYGSHSYPGIAIVSNSNSNSNNTAGFHVIKCIRVLVYGKFNQTIPVNILRSKDKIILESL